MEGLPSNTECGKPVRWGNGTCHIGVTAGHPLFGLPIGDSGWLEPDNATVWWLGENYLEREHSPVDAFALIYGCIKIMEKRMNVRLD